MKKIVIITSLSSLQGRISDILFDGTAPVRSNGGLLGFWGNSQVLVCLSAVGKVNLAVTAGSLISEVKPDAVITIGIAKSLVSALLPGSIVVGSHFCYYDVSYGINNEFGRYPGEPSFYRSDDRIVSRMVDVGLSFHQGLVVSGDSIIGNRKTANGIRNHFSKAKACDMESAAIAQVCHKNAVPFVSIRAIDDVVVMEDKAKAMYPQFKNVSQDDMLDRLVCVLNKTMESI